MLLLQFFSTNSPSSFAFAVWACALFWPLGTSRSWTRLRSPLTPCSAAPGSRHRRCPQTTPQFPRLWAPHRRSREQGLGWMCEVYITLYADDVLQFSWQWFWTKCEDGCDSHSQHRVFADFWFTLTERFVLTHRDLFTLPKAFKLSFFFFKVFQMW